MNGRAGLCVAIIAVATASHSSASQLGPPVEAGRGSLAAARKYLEGRWGLISYDILPPGEPPIHLSGEGALRFDPFGNLEVEIRVDDATAARLERAGVPASGGRLSIAGRVLVDMQGRTLTYFLEGQPPFGAPSGPLALNRPRHWTVEGQVLTLTTRGADGQPLSIGRWQKVP